MNSKRLIILAAFLVICIPHYGQQLTQESYNSSSGNGQDSQTQISWTIGESVIETYQTSNNFLTQGFHQTSLLITGLDDCEPAFTINIFPNPTTEILNIQLERKDRNLSYQIFDTNGKLLESSVIIDNNTRVNTSEFNNGTYILILTEADHQTVKTYKIIKNK